MDWTQTGVEKADVLFTSSNSTGLISTGALDVRAYSSYYFSHRVQTLAAGTQYNFFLVAIEWSSTSTFTDTVFTERYGIFAYSSSGTFITYGGKLEAQDQIHGPYMRITVTAPNGSDAIGQGVSSLVGSTRLLNAASIREVGFAGTNDESDENWIIHPKNGFFTNVAVGTVVIPGLMRLSAARWRLNTSASLGVSLIGSVPTIGAPPTYVFETYGTGAGPISNQTNITPMYMPHLPTIWSVSNPGAGVANIQFSIISEEVRSR